jgi:hypothetical protein
MFDYQAVDGVARTACLASRQIRAIRERHETHVESIEHFLGCISERMRLEKFRAEGNVSLSEIDLVTAHVITTIFLPELSVGEDSEFLRRLLLVVDRRFAAPLAKIVDACGGTAAMTHEEMQEIEDVCYRVAFKMSEFSHGTIFGIRHQYN